MSNDDQKPTNSQLFAATLQPINLKAPNLAKEWKMWHTQFKIFLRASDLESQSDKRKVALMLHYIGSKSLEIFNSFDFDIDTVKYEDLVNKMAAFFIPQINIVMERHTFFTNKQQEEQTVDEFVTVLKNLSLNCEFKDLRDALIRDIFICGLSPKLANIRERLLTEGDISLEKAVSIANTMVIVKQNSTILQQDSDAEGIINVVTRKNAEYSQHNNDYQSNNAYNNRNKKNYNRKNNQACIRCGHSHNVKCPAEGVKCYECGKINHFAKMCLLKKRVVKQMVTDGETKEDLFVGAVTKNNKNTTEWNVEISEQNYNYNEQDLNDDFSLQSSSSSCNDDNNDNNKNFVYDKRKFTELIIKYYKDYPVLWQPNHSENKNIPKHQEVYKKITKLINKELNLNLKCIQIKGKINKLRSKFRKEHELLTEFSNYNEIDMDIDDISTTPIHTTSWLYEQMSFLKDYISDGRKRSKRGSKALTNDKNYLPLAKFSIEENQQFIELYKSYPCLWDVNHIGFRFKNQRQESLQELLEVVNKQLNLELSSEDLQKKLYCIRYAVTQEKHRQIECERLKIEFIPQCKLYNELLFLKDSVGPFKCEHCEQIFNGPDQYRVHKSSHDGSMPYSCPQCNKGFMKIGNCTVHLRRHTKDFQFECQECGKKFPTSTDLNVHTRHHTGEKPYFCDICGQSFRTWTYFDSHRRRHEKKPNHLCSICLKGFYEHNKLKQHMKSHMNVRDKVCNVCGKSFTCTKYLNQHKLTHAEKKKYSCKICGKKFSQHGGLSNHIKSHNTITANEGINNDNV